MQTVFKGWEIDKCIGEGAFGKVYRIVREDFGYTYEAAMKVIEIPQNQSELDTVRNDGMTEENITSYFYGMVEDIVEEFALMSKLKGNSNIVSYEDHAVVKKAKGFGWVIFIRMELLTPLFTHVKENNMTVRDVIQLGIDLCHALEVCQKYHIIHRDIKPENIFISDVGTYKLGDFGIARELEKTSSGLSKKGTKSYMAPEVYKGLEYNSTVDVYSLGIVLYRFLNNNRLPFMPPSPQPIKYSDKERADVMRMSGQAMPKPIHADGRLAEIVLKACAYVPKERYESAHAFRLALEEILYSETESELIYPQGDVLENKKAEYVSDTFKSSVKKAQPVQEEKEGTVYLFQKEPSVKNTEGENVSVKNNYINNKTSVQDNILPKNSNVINSDIQRSINYQNIQGRNVQIIPGRDREIKKKLIIGGVFVFIAAIVFCVIKIAGNSKEPSVSVDVQRIASKNENKDITVTVEPKKIETPKTEMPKTEAPKPETVRVPDFTELTKADAEKLAKQYKIIVTVNSEYSDKIQSGKTIKQKPEKDTEVEIGSAVNLTISKGVEKVKVPSVAGMSLENAVERLKKHKLKYKTKHEYSQNTKKGRIVTQSVAADKMVKKGTVVTVTVSKGKKPEPTPKPIVTKKPVVTKRPVVTKKPVATKKPAATKKPKVTKKPSNDYDFDLSGF